MAADERPGADGVPPPGELIHLPGPSYLPVLLAFGITLSVIGVVIWLPVTVIGVITTVTHPRALDPRGARGDGRAAARAASSPSLSARSVAVLDADAGPLVVRLNRRWRSAPR